MREKYIKEKNIRPPRVAIRFLQWFCPSVLRESIEGDLLEQFEVDLSLNRSRWSDGYRVRRAQWRFAWNVLKFFRPGIILRNKLPSHRIHTAMFKSYFKISYRHLSKNKTFAAINIFGLATGMAAALLIYEYVSFEKSFDRFHTNADHIYRVTTEWNKDVTPGDKRATTVPWSGPGAKAEFPEVLEYARFAPIDNFTGPNVVRYNKTEIDEQNIFLADPGFLKMFSFPLVKGDPESALNDPTSVVITESIAKKYFNSEDPIGKILFIDSHGNLTENNFKITGVIQDPPENTHITFDFLISFNVIWQSLHNGSTYWHWDYTYAYLLLHPETDVSSLEKKMSALRVDRFGKEMEYYDDKIDFRLQPLKDIHLFSSLKGEALINGDGKSLYFIVIIGICIILCAYINYINLSTVKAVERRTEVGIRKVVGSSRFQLTTQLLVESFVLNGLSLVIAFLIFRLSVPVIESIFNIDWPSWNNKLISADFMLFVALIVIGGILLSAFYPAFILSSFKPAEVLKGKGTVAGSYRRWDLRKSLIVLQFIFCIAFCTGTFLLYRQLRFMKDHDLGMNPSQVLVVSGYGFQPYSVYEAFKNNLSNQSFIHSIGYSSAVPGEEIIQLGLKPKVTVAGSASDKKELKLITIDEHYFQTLEVQIISGRNFERSIITDEKSAIINEAAARLLGYEEPNDILNESVTGLAEQDLKIIGVIKNYNQRSLKNDYEPVIFVPNWTDKFGWNKRYFFVKLNPVHSLKERQQQIRVVENAWKEVSPDKPFQYFFLDSHFDHQYKSDSTFTSLFMFFSLLAIFIACLGLFGLVAYTTFQRTKEIGIRKILGASAQNILMLLSGDFIKLILIASLFSIPLILWGGRYWLDQYAFRIDLSIGLFLFPLTFIFMLAMITVVLKSLKVAVSNPVDSLRNE